MIITSSRANSTYCWRYAFNTYHRNLMTPRSMNLLDGSGLHDAAAVGFATKDWDLAKIEAKKKFLASVPESNISDLPNESEVSGDHWDMVEAMINCFRDGVADAPYTVIQPECNIDVPIPHSHHNCIWLHHIETQFDGTWEEKWGPPSPEAILEKRVASPHGLGPMEDCSCWTPHRILGTTDALVTWERRLWIHEYKTDSTAGDTFWAQWELDMQPTLYIYGVWKTLGVAPTGVIVHRVRKPSEKQVSNWNAKRKYGPPKEVSDYITYERECFTRTTEDLSRIEWCMKELCDEWEHRILNGWFRPVLSKTACVRWGRRCDFHVACSNHEEEGAFAGLGPRNMRYDDEAISKLIQLATPHAIPQT